MDENDTVQVNTTSDKAEPNPTDIWFWIIMGTIGGVAFLGNSLVIFIITTRRRLHTTSNSFILSLSISDLFTAVTTIPGSFICYFAGLRCSPIFGLLCNYFICASVMNVCTMAGDRFCRVVYPLRYPVLMSSKRIVLTITLGWTLPVFLQIIPSLYIMLSPTIDTQSAQSILDVIQMFTFAILPSAGLLLAYAKISSITLNHSRRQRVQVEQINTNSTIRQQATRKSYSVLVLGAVIFLFVLCWSFTIYRGICNSFQLCNVQRPVIFVSRIFLASNTAADPIVYAILKKDIRRELVLAFTKNRLRVQDLHLTETRIGAQSN